MTITQEIVLNGNWEFGYHHALSGDVPVPFDQIDFFSSMPVPAYWDDRAGAFEGDEIKGLVRRNPDHRPVDYAKEVTHEHYYDLRSSLPYIMGVGYYRKRVAVPADWEGKQLFLQIGGVSQQAWVFVNNQQAGHHFGHSTAFEMDVTGHCVPGKDNEVVIAVTNLGPDRGGYALQGYKGKTAGIYRPVTLRATGESAVADCYVHPNAELTELTWTVALHGATDGVAVEWAILHPLTAEVLGSGTVAAGDAQPTWKSSTFGMTCWSDREAVLYDIRVTTRKGGAVLDQRSQKFGLRRLSRNGVDLLLNNQPVFLRGVTDHCFFAATCNPPSDKDTYLDILRRHKQLGFNWIRFHTWIPSEEYMQAADELGILFMVEAPRGFEEAEWLDIIRACRTHPSVVIYSGGNEECLDEARIEKLAVMADHVHTKVPDALFNPQEALRGVEYCWDEPDFGGNTIEEPFKHNPTRLRRLKEFSDVFGQYSWGLLSYNLVKGDRHELDRRHALYGAPLFAHEISIKGSYIDFDLEHRMAGTRIGPDMYESSREILQQQGLYHNAGRYYSNSCAWLRIFRKYVIEMARKCTCNRGYDLLGGHDHHCAYQGFHGGLMNDFFEIKPGESVADVLQYNGESVLLLDTTVDRNLRPGDTFNVPLLLSYYSQPDLEQACVSWHVRDDAGRILVRGDWEIGAVKSGSLTEIGPVAFTVPAVPRATKLRVFVRLSGSTQELTNDWDYWCFPDINHSLSGDMIVADRLDEATIAALESGARVALLGNGGLPNRGLEHQIIMAGRVRGNLATVIYDHPLADQFPHDGWASWQFNNMFNDATTVVFNDLDVVFDPIIEVVSSYKLIRKQACLFEARVGKGRLLVCSMDLSKEDPGSVYMKNAIMRYVDSAAFQPRNAFAASILREFSANPSPDVAVVAEAAAANREGNVDQVVKST